MKRLLWFAADFVFAAIIIAAVWVVNYLIPQKGVKVQSSQSIVSEATAQTMTSEKLQQKLEPSSNELSSESVLSQSRGQMFSQGDTTQAEKYEQTALFQSTNVVLDTQDWHRKFADKFTDKVVATEDSYTSPDISIQLTHGTYDSGKTDSSDSGKHLKYGTSISYVLADIYVGDITCIQTAFAEDTYGVGYNEKLSSMSNRMKSILAVNGDSYSNNRHKNNGTIIRNGVIYRSMQTDAETCVLNWDGKMDIYAPGKLDTQTLIDNGAYQSWIFGPSLLDENGKAKTSFVTWDYIRQSHPRTAIGYYEPGHYCLLVVDGRQSSSRGMFPDEMAQIFEILGCKAAYNLDGGHCSFMTYNGSVENHPYKPEHTVTDGIFIVPGTGRQNG